MNAGRVSKLGWAERLFATCGVWLIGLGCYFIFIRPARMPGDLHFTGTTLARLQAAAPRISDWSDLVFKVMCGFMSGMGVLVIYAALRVLPQRPTGARPVMLLTGALTVGLMSAVNFALGSDFKLLDRSSLSGMSEDVKPKPKSDDAAVRDLWFRPAGNEVELKVPQ